MNMVHPNSEQYATSADDTADPLSAAVAVAPEIKGGGCLARFAPEELTDNMGADFSNCIDLLPPGDSL